MSGSEAVRTEGTSRGILRSPRDVGTFRTSVDRPGVVEPPSEPEWLPQRSEETHVGEREGERDRGYGPPERSRGVVAREEGPDAPIQESSERTDGSAHGGATIDGKDA